MWTSDTRMDNLHGFKTLAPDEMARVEGGGFWGKLWGGIKAAFDYFFDHCDTTVGSNGTTVTCK